MYTDTRCLAQTMQSYWMLETDSRTTLRLTEWSPITLESLRPQTTWQIIPGNDSCSTLTAHQLCDRAPQTTPPSWAHWPPSLQLLGRPLAAGGSQGWCWLEDRETLAEDRWPGWLHLKALVCSDRRKGDTGWRKDGEIL